MVDAPGNTRRMLSRIKGDMDYSSVERLLGAKADEIVRNGEEVVASWDDIHVIFRRKIKFLPPELEDVPTVKQIVLGFHPTHRPELQELNWSGYAEEKLRPPLRTWPRSKREQPLNFEQWDANGVTLAKSAADAWRRIPPAEWDEPYTRDDLDVVVYDERLGRYFRLAGQRRHASGPDINAAYAEFYVLVVVPRDEEPRQP